MTAIAIDPISDLIKFYRSYDPLRSDSVTDEYLREYYEIMLTKDRIIACYDGQGDMLGFVETWRVNFDQLGRILCGITFNVRTEDISTGQVAYLANIAIRPDARRGDVIRWLKHEFFKRHFMCDFFCGESRRKKHAPFSVFTRQEYYEKYGETHGEN